jgi:hypothetical protein
LYATKYGTFYRTTINQRHIFKRAFSKKPLFLGGLGLKNHVEGNVWAHFCLPSNNINKKKINQEEGQSQECHVNAFEIQAF